MQSSSRPEYKFALYDEKILTYEELLRAILIKKMELQMDKKILKTKKDNDKKMDKLVKEDKKRDKKIEKCDHDMKRKK